MKLECDSFSPADKRDLSLFLAWGPSLQNEMSIVLLGH